MKLVFISDTHQKHRDIIVPDGDVLIHAGDVSMAGKISAYSDFADWFQKLPHIQKILVAGNHDFGTKYLVEMFNVPNVHYLQNSSVIIEGVKFYGSPFTPRFGLWEWMEERGEPIRQIWNLIPNDTDVLITHGPPYGILDKTVQGIHAGCEELMEVVDIIKPKIHAFGHIHEGYGLIKTPIIHTTFINASVVNQHYDVANAPVEMVIDYEIR